MTSRPLATAVSALAEGPRAPLAELSDPAAVLAGLMDLHGSVSLARELSLLDRPAAPAAAAAAVDAARAEVRALVAERLGELA
ncbi:MAG TPA: hypothetical protein VL242_27215, partial [Sorangium sp.]|nr:hypothetical protein [Sorangium sp.]